MRESARASSRYQRKVWEEAEQSALEAIRKAGVAIEENVDREAFRRKVAAMFEDQPGEIRDLIRRIRSE